LSPSPLSRPSFLSLSLAQRFFTAQSAQLIASPIPTTEWLSINLANALKRHTLSLLDRLFDPPPFSDPGRQAAHINAVASVIPNMDDAAAFLRARFRVSHLPVILIAGLPAQVSLPSLIERAAETLLATSYRDEGLTVAAALSQAGVLPDAYLASLPPFVLLDASRPVHLDNLLASDLPVLVVDDATAHYDLRRLFEGPAAASDVLGPRIALAGRRDLDAPLGTFTPTRHAPPVPDFPHLVALADQRADLPEADLAAYWSCRYSASPSAVLLYRAVYPFLASRFVDLVSLLAWTASVAVAWSQSTHLISAVAAEACSQHEAVQEAVRLSVAAATKASAAFPGVNARSAPVLEPPPATDTPPGAATFAATQLPNAAPLKTFRQSVTLQIRTRRDPDLLLPLFRASTLLDAVHTSGWTTGALRLYAGNRDHRVSQLMGQLGATGADQRVTFASLPPSRQALFIAKLPAGLDETVQLHWAQLTGSPLGSGGAQSALLLSSSPYCPIRGPNVLITTPAATVSAADCGRAVEGLLSAPPLPTASSVITASMTAVAALLQPTLFGAFAALQCRDSLLAHGIQLAQDLDYIAAEAARKCLPTPAPGSGFQVADASDRRSNARFRFVRLPPSDETQVLLSVGAVRRLATFFAECTMPEGPHTRMLLAPNALKEPLVFGLDLDLRAGPHPMLIGSCLDQTVETLSAAGLTVVTVLLSVKLQDHSVPLPPSPSRANSIDFELRQFALSERERLRAASPDDPRVGAISVDELPFNAVVLPSSLMQTADKLFPARFRDFLRARHAFLSRSQ
jgi:hypothetical protein